MTLAGTDLDFTGAAMPSVVVMAGVVVRVGTAGIAEAVVIWAAITEVVVTWAEMVAAADVHPACIEALRVARVPAWLHRVAAA
jgi:hypothetical protein